MLSMHVVFLICDIYVFHFRYFDFILFRVYIVLLCGLGFIVVRFITFLLPIYLYLIIIKDGQCWLYNSGL